MQREYYPCAKTGTPWWIWGIIPSVPSISPKVLWVLREFLITRIKYSCLCALYGVLWWLLKLVPFLALEDLLYLLLSTGKVLSYLLEKGILYTDLHPSNVLIRTLDGHLAITLLDFTYCYYFLNNPNPPYELRFSYNLSPDLKGQQMLIQELTYFLHALLEIKEQQRTGKKEPLPFSVCMLLETGNHPPENLSLQEFLIMIQKCFLSF